MIIQCESCSRKFVVRNEDIPDKGRMVQCGYCSVTWHQMPVSIRTKPIIQKNKPSTKINENLSVDNIKASDGKTYRFLGSQWAELLPSGKTGLFAKKKIGKELDKLTGREIKTTIKKKTKKEVNPSLVSLDNGKKLPKVYEPKPRLGFFGYIFLIIIIGFSLIGVLKTFENDLLNQFIEAEYIFEILDEQLEYFAETFRNIIEIIKDLADSY